MGIGGSTVDAHALHRQLTKDLEAADASLNDASFSNRSALQTFVGIPFKI